MTGYRKNDRLETTPVLEFTRASFEGSGETSIRMNGFSGTIAAGELVAVELERHHDPHDITSSMLGLVDLRSGSIEFLGEDWLGNDYSRHFEMRSRIGRVFSRSAWVQSLTVRDNVHLSMLHHGVDQVTAESQVKRWSDRIGGSQSVAVQKCMDQRPSVVEPSLLQVCQLVRAVCNEPQLLILERPLQYMPDERYDDFVTVIDDLRSMGTGVLFFAGDRDEVELAFRVPVTRWDIVDDTLKTGGGSDR